ncbi:hypothetical protein [Kiloniella antarctica]|uniref:Lipoprotein n=1 Tax=Kiloniella antarctica TaxID=1550907 RepID=A0ABW5BLS9_9PROT
MLLRTLLISCFLILPGCVASEQNPGDQNYVVTADSLWDTPEESLLEKGLEPLSGEVITNLITNKTIVGEYISTPTIPIDDRATRWMEYYLADGTSKYRSCESLNTNTRWNCSAKLNGHWKIFDNKLCLKYRNSKSYTHCVRVYLDGEEYLFVATTTKAAGYVRGIVRKAMDGFVEEPPFNS